MTAVTIVLAVGVVVGPLTLAAFGGWLARTGTLTIRRPARPRPPKETQP